jgi:hypothetical protein
MLVDQHETLQVFPPCEHLGNRWPLILDLMFMCLSPLSRRWDLMHAHCTMSENKLADNNDTIT